MLRRTSAPSRLLPDYPETTWHRRSMLRTFRPRPSDMPRLQPTAGRTSNKLNMKKPTVFNMKEDGTQLRMAGSKAQQRQGLQLQHRRMIRTLLSRALSAQAVEA